MKDAVAAHNDTEEITVADGYLPPEARGLEPVDREPPQPVPCAAGVEAGSRRRLSVHVFIGWAADVALTRIRSPGSTLAATARRAVAAGPRPGRRGCDDARVSSAPSAEKLSMAPDPVHSAQQLVRGAGQRMRDVGVLPEKRWKRQEFEGEKLEDFLAYGRRQVTRLDDLLGAYTGAGLEGRRALDFGCGTGRTAVALAARCEHVYGLDIMDGALQKAATTAVQVGVQNVDWLAATELAGLAGRYDAVISMWVFQHIPSREGERIFARILEGLAPEGVGAVHFALRPPRALAGLRAALAAAGRSPRRRLRATLAYAYLLMNSYSLNRLGEILFEAGVGSWEIDWFHSGLADTGNATGYPNATLIFRKRAAA